MLGVAEPTDQGDDVQAELVLRQGETPLRLGAEAGLVARAVGVAAAADLQVQADQPLEGHDSPLGRGRGPERPGAGGAGPRGGARFQGPGCRGAGTASPRGGYSAQTRPAQG